MQNRFLSVYQHSLFRYLLIGGSTFALDLGGLVVLHGIMDISVLVAASISYWLSIAYNFVMNRIWTFGVKKPDKLHKHIVLYGLLLGFNYIFTLISIALATHFGLHYTVAKIMTVAIQVSWTYYAYKIIFK